VTRCRGAPIGPVPSGAPRVLPSSPLTKEGLHASNRRAARAQPGLPRPDLVAGRRRRLRPHDRDRGFVVRPSAWTVSAQDDLHVCWHNGDPFTHTATANTGIFDTGFLSSGADADVQLLGAGAYRYHCQIHGFMNGTITVRPHASAAIARGQTFVLRIGDQGTFVPAPT
jgi:plastocyanin